MVEKIVPQFDCKELRRIAENQLGETKKAEPRIVSGEQRLLHEIEVHQIELEMQNAELGNARNEAEKMLEKYTELYDFAPVGYFTLDSKGTICSVNLTGSDLLGIERSRLNGRPFEHFIAAAARPAFATFLGTIFTSLAKGTCNVAVLKKGNPQLIVQIEAVAAASGQECRLALVDITQRMRAEEALRKEQMAAVALRLEKEAAEETARTKSQFLVNMSHELRTPMTGILGMLQLALEEDLDPVPRGYLATALRSAQSLLRILNDILVMAKIEVGKLTIEEEPFSLQGCLTDAVEVISPDLRRKGLEFAISVAKEIPDTVVGDQMRLKQVLINIIGNAVKFTERGKVVVRLTAGKATSKGRRKFTFSITDTGIGIPDDKKGLLFRAFSQVDASYSRSFGGTGLGLAISREIVELMGGRISFESEVGVGSTFSFTIPLAEAGPKSEALPAIEPNFTETVVPAPGGERVRHILLAEDDMTIREVLGRMLSRASFQVDFAEDGLKAVEMWEKGSYDLVLMDVQMPRCNGLDTARAIREKEQVRGGCHIPIVALTAHALKEDEQRCLAAGMDAFISKPIDFEKTLHVIRSMLLPK